MHSAHVVLATWLAASSSATNTKGSSILSILPLIFIFGNIIRSGKEEWVEVGYPHFEKLEF